MPHIINRMDLPIRKKLSVQMPHIIPGCHLPIRKKLSVQMQPGAYNPNLAKCSRVFCMTFMNEGAFLISQCSLKN